MSVKSIAEQMFLKLGPIGTVKFMKAIQFYAYQFKINSGNPGAALSGFYELIDSEIAEAIQSSGLKPSCKAGCAHCCRIAVECTVVETDAVVRYAAENKIIIDQEKLLRQSRLDNNQYMRSADNACVFLDGDNKCKIYPVRPMACRKYLVVGDPRKCNWDMGEQEVMVLSNANIDAIAYGLIAANDTPQESGVFSQMMLTSLEKYNNNPEKS